MRISLSFLNLSFLLLLSVACSSTDQSSRSTPGSNLASASAPAARGVLDGKVFDVVLVEASGQKSPDQLVFDGAKFESTACRPYGFQPAQYAGHAQGDDVAFEASAKAKDTATNAWSGTVRGSSVRGTMTCTNGKGEAVHYTYEGKLASGALDGRSFEVEMVGADGKNQDKDRLSFAGGSVDSTSCRPFGFLRAAYTTTPEGDGLRFEAVAASAEYGLNHWQGTVRGDQIEGTLKSGESAEAPVLRFSGKRIP
jgi:hypothetical protein